MAPVRLALFDLDGTLVDSQRDLAESVSELLSECGCGPLSEQAIVRMVGHGAPILVARAFAAAGCPAPADALKRFLAIYDSRLLRFTRPYPGMTAVLGELSSRLMLGVLTNKAIAPTNRILEGLELSRFFPASRVLGGDGPLPRKPDPAGLHRLAAEALVTPGETMLVGDSTTDLRTARQAGAQVCLARYGFGFADVSPEELGSDVPVIGAAQDLLAIL